MKNKGISTKSRKRVDYFQPDHEDNGSKRQRKIINTVPCHSEDIHTALGIIFSSLTPGIWLRVLDSEQPNDNIYDNSGMPFNLLTSMLLELKLLQVRNNKMEVMLNNLTDYCRNHCPSCQVTNYRPFGSKTCPVFICNEINEIRTR